MMIKTLTTESGRLELIRLNLDIESVITGILEYVPKADIVGLDHVLVSDLPGKWKKYRAEAMGAYFEKKADAPAHVELYLKVMFSHIQRAESLHQMLPIQFVGIAQTLYHEIGHHVERTRTHGIDRSKREKYAESYSKRLLDRYILDNVGPIDACFDHLESIAEERGLSQEALMQMRNGWKKQYEAALARTAGSRRHIE